MVRMIELTEEEAIEYMQENKCNIFLVVAEDMSRDVFLGRKYINKKKGIALIKKSQTVILNEDNENEDSFSLMSLFMDIQSDIFNIVPKGEKHEIVFLEPTILKNEQKIERMFE